ncbi:DUF6969 family protein [Aestuariispira insulae]|uniref:DUF6969 domain-containing protein n=1 Tax=Aestuariispira insulae TaxID=1461337 RepID=A0A3D9HGR5_9PROT|nr:hypothetical protein [Aestuariispira insulae]RED48660.1 hypothetical protein DFP90_107165 [Aestuariispira insulae]
MNGEFGADKPLAMDDRHWRDLAPDRLRKMQAAGAEILKCYHVLTKVNANVVGELLKTADTFFEWDHYPKGDVYDRDTHAQYYYHAHRGVDNEHGHFHTFMRRKGIPAEIQPLADQGSAKVPEGDDILSHLIAISMVPAGYPFILFSTNRWVTGENWFKASDVVSMLDHFEIDHAWPSWPTNRWISAMIILFRPQIVALLEERDRVVAEWAEKHPDRDVYEDRSLEITSYMPVSVEEQIARINQELSSRAAA